MIKQNSFTHINQFRNVISDVNHFYDGKEKPIITFEATIKLHGSNAGVCYDGTNMWVQSRKNVITVEKDNAGFASFVESHKEWFEIILKDLYKEGYVVSLYGEWCGKGIQKGVAINELSKRFVLFAVKYTSVVDEADHYYVKPKVSFPANDVYNIWDFKTWTIDIDFKNPGYAQNQIVEWVTEVEKECPFAKEFGISGIGEGIVFSAFGEDNHRRFIFKAKGEKHSASKVKTIAKIDPEKMYSINEFVDYSVTENRLNQAIEQVFTITSEELSIKKMGDFLRWIVNDINREEADTMSSNELEPKDVNKYISTKARVWFMEYLDTLVMVK
jgi:hypothetical protein